MNLGIASLQARTYSVATPVYEGPLDLLLQLIERAELDITKLALAQVTDQYLYHLHQMQERAAEEVSAFLVIAAKLIQIKSEVLLPRPPQREEGEEDPGEALTRQLLAYKRYKTIADILDRRQEQNLHTYLRVAPAVKIEGTLDLSGVTLADLVSTAKRIFVQIDTRSDLKTIVSAPPVTIRQKITLIARLLREKGEITFRAVLNRTRSRLEIVVTFLAMLELIKRHKIEASQETIFGEINLQPSEAWDENEEFELEFGE